MCHISPGRQVSQENMMCSCECGCPIMLPVDEEIRKLEDHKKIFLERIDTIDKKLTSLKTIRES